MVENVVAFRTANAEHPVIEGSVTSIDGVWGANYRLSDGRVFRLSTEECQQVSPIWWDRQAKPSTALHPSETAQRREGDRG